MNADLKYAYQKDFDSAKDVLNDAIDNLVLVGADYSKVDSIKAEAEKVLASDNYTKDYYTEATRATFDKANKALNDLADDLTILEQNKVDDAIELLTEAINGLTLKGADYSKLDVVKKEAEKVLISDNYTKGHYTDDDQMIYGYGIVTLLALGGLMMLKRHHTS